MNTSQESNLLDLKKQTLSLSAKVPFLKDRAFMFQKARAFFNERNILEVDCPALSHGAPIDLHIDVMKVLFKTREIGYLHTSPEYGMKRLLSAGIGDIYQISHVFRDGEVGPLHNPEFTMVEWYRMGFTFEQMIEETLDFIRLFLGDLAAVQRMNYRQALQHYLDIDYMTSSTDQLLDCANNHDIDLGNDALTWDKDTLLQLLVSFIMEPKLGNDHLFVLSYFPASQAALAKTSILPDGESVACRFEVYYQGIELANGYYELTDPIEQHKRFEATNCARVKAGKEPLIMDERFLEALRHGLPDCCGVAVGFDRLMQLKHGLKELQNVLPFTWEEN